MQKELGDIYIYRKLYCPKKTMKIGSTFDFLKRMNVYKTSECDFDNETLEIWKFNIVDSEYDCTMLDEIIRYASKNKNLPFKYYEGSGGIEHYYYDNIYNLIFFFNNINIKFEYQKINVDELREDMKKIKYEDSQKFCEKENNKKNKIKITKEIEDIIKSKLSKCVKPRIDQEIIINETYEHFNLYDKGLLILMCGIGKTLISLWISQMMKMNTILVGVPNLLLLEQWKNEIMKVFPNYKILLVKYGVEKHMIKDYF